MGKFLMIMVPKQIMGRLDLLSVQSRKMITNLVATALLGLVVIM